MLSIIKKIRNWDNLRNRNKSILVKTKQALSAIGNTVIPGAENSVLVSIYKTKSGKNQL